MKIRSCFEIALFELRHSFKIFLFYSVICVSLMAVSTSLLKAAMTIPDKISGIAHGLNADSIEIYDYKIDKIENVINNVNIISCRSGMVGDATNIFWEKYADNMWISGLSSGILINSDKFTNESQEYIPENLLSGEFSPDKDNNPVWINNIMANKLNLKCGDILNGSTFSGQPIKLVIQGIFKDEVEYYYVNEQTWELIVGDSEPVKNVYWVRCHQFSDLNKIQKILKKYNIEYSCQDMMFRSLNIMYAAFYSSSIILIVDTNLNILDLNKVGEKAFNIDIKTVKNKALSLIMPDKDFRHVIRSEENLEGRKLNLEKYGLIVYERIIYLPKNKILFGILNDITDEELKKEQITNFKLNTLETADKVIEKQMRVAQEIAGLLGETTAETKAALLKLKKVVIEENE